MIAIVPIKAISERVPNKNFRDFNGKPLFHHIFDSLTQCKWISRIVLTTDEPWVADLIKSKYSYVQTILRPEHLLGHHITANALIEHVLETIEGDINFIYTHTTNPLLTRASIERAMEIYFHMPLHYDSLLAVTKHQMRLFDHHGKPLNHEPSKIVPSQQLIPVYEDNSNLYIFSRDSFKENGRVGKYPYLFQMDKLEALDIDTEEDFILAEEIMKNHGYKNHHTRTLELNPVPKQTYG